MFLCHRKHHPKQVTCQSKCGSSYNNYTYTNVSANVSRAPGGTVISSKHQSSRISSWSWYLLLTLAPSGSTIFSYITFVAKVQRSYQMSVLSSLMRLSHACSTVGSSCIREVC